MKDVSPSKKSRPVRIEWKLPARLRKPIREQLRKERAKAAAIHFEKKQIRTPKLVEARKIIQNQIHSIRLPKHRFLAPVSSSDVTADPVSSILVAPPPYAVSRKKTPSRSHTKRMVAKSHPRKAVRKKVTGALVRDLHVPATRAHLAPRPPKKKTKPLIIQERDITYTFPQEAEVLQQLAPEPILESDMSVEHRAVVRKPKVLLSSGISISVLRKVVSSPASMVNMAFLLSGFAFASFFMWNLQGAGRGTAALSDIQQKAKLAFSHVTQAQGALANTNVTESEKQFSQASQELSSAKSDMDEALAASKSILQILDITGTVRSGQEILDMGVALADAGVHMSRAIAPFLSVTLTTSLSDAIIAAKPHLENTEQAVDVAQEKMDRIQTSLLPNDVADDIERLRVLLPQAKNTLHHLVEESGTLLALVGADRDRQYLILFANNDEIRPVGGFIGTVGLVNVSRGKVENIDVKSVYDGDGQLKKFLAPPNPLLPIVNRWFLRDSNWFVDYKASAQKAAQLFEKEGGPTVDGVIMLTPKLIQNLLRTTGPITVPGYDVAVTADNFVEVTQGEVTYNYDKELNKPKQFLSDLTPLLLTRLFSSPSNTGNGKMKTLEALTQSLTEKDLLLYFKDEHAQEEATHLGWTGTLPKDAQGFLMVNNANVGGHKSDQFIEQEIDYRTTIAANGDVDVVLTVRRIHHGPEEKLNYPYPPGEDPSQKDNVIYQRTFVPQGAQLLETKGFTLESDVPRPILSDSSLQLEADPDLVAWQGAQKRLPDGTVQGTESGYTFFANWVITKPGQTSVTLYHYRIPNAVSMPNFLKSASSYALSIAKQPGQKRTTLRASIELPSSVKIVRSVPDSGVTLESDTKFVYRGELTSDKVPGIVFEKR